MPDTDRDGILDAVERDDDADGVLDRRDGSDQGWGIPDALQEVEDQDQDSDEDGKLDQKLDNPCFAAAPAGIADALSSTRDLDCEIPLAAPHVPPARELRAAGMKLRRARIDGMKLRLEVRTKHARRLRFEVLRDGKTVTGGTAIARPGKRSLRTELDAPPEPGVDTLRIGIRGRNLDHLIPVRVAPLPPAATPLGPREALTDVSGATAGTICISGSPVTDSDGDGVCDATETEGFTFNVYSVKGDKTPVQTRKVTSDPNDPNSDADQESTPAGTFALSDGAEWASYLGGGISDPSNADSDSDGLTDVAELNRFGTAPNALDTDGDSVSAASGLSASDFHDGAELNLATRSPNLPATSPQLADTDGDSFRRLGRVGRGVGTGQLEPARGATAPVQDLSCSRERGYGGDPGDEIGGDGQEGDDRVLDRYRADRRAHHRDRPRAEAQGRRRLRGGLPPPRRAGRSQREVRPWVHRSTPREGSEWLDGTTTTDQSSFSKSSKESAQQEYERSTRVEFKDSGTLSTDFIVTNTGQVPFHLGNPNAQGDTAHALGILARTICVPSEATEGSGCVDPGGDQPSLTTMGVMTARAGGAPVTDIALAPGARGQFSFSADVSRQELQGYLANPGDLMFKPTNINLYNTDSPAKALVDLLGNKLDTQTAKLTVDFGNGTVQSFQVATVVDRSWGSPGQGSGLKMPAAAKAINDQRTEFGYEAVRNDPPLPQTQTLSKVSIAVDGRPEVSQTAIPSDPDVALPGAWLAFGTAAGLDDKTDFDDVRLLAGRGLGLSYLIDNDEGGRDGLFSREERLLGTSDADRDSDGDSATGKGPDGTRYASDFFESSVGWSSPFPKDKEPRQVYSSPTSCDVDGDGSPDGPGTPAAPKRPCPESQYGTELSQRSDPTYPDTNGNGVLDGADAKPVDAFTTGAAWRPSDLRSAPGPGKDAPAPVLSADGWTLSKPGQTVSTKPLGICAASGGGDPCAGSGGYYRATWTMTATTETSTIQDVSQGSWTVTSGGANCEVSVPPPPGCNDLLQAKLEASEVQSGGQDFELYLHLRTSPSDLQLAYTQAAGSTLISGLKLEPLSSTEYLAGAERPGFAAISFPGGDLTPGDSAVAPSGAQALKIAAGSQQSPFAMRAWGSAAGFDLPPGGYRAAFALRIGNNALDDDQIATTDVSWSPSAPPSREPIADTSANAQGVIAPTAGNYDDPMVRRPIAAGRVWRGDFAQANQLQYMNVLFEQRGTSSNVSPSVVTKRTIGSDLYLDNVVFERAPYLRRAANTPTNTYNGAGWSAYAKYEESGVCDGDVDRLHCWHDGEVVAESGPSGEPVLRVPTLDGRQYEDTLWSAHIPVDNRFNEFGMLGTWLFPGNCNGDPLGFKYWFRDQDIDRADKHNFFVQKLTMVFKNPDNSYNAHNVQIPKNCPPAQINQVFSWNRPRQVGGVSIAGGAGKTSSRHVQVSVVPPAGAERFQISNSRDFARAESHPARRTVLDWQLAPLGDGGGTREVYVRFSGTDRVAPGDLFVDDIANAG